MDGKNPIQWMPIGATNVKQKEKNQKSMELKNGYVDPPEKLGVVENGWNFDFEETIPLMEHVKHRPWWRIYMCGIKI